MVPSCYSPKRCGAREHFPKNMRLIKNENPGSISIVLLDFAQALQPACKKGFEWYDYDADK